MEAISLCIESITAEEKPNRVELHERLYYSLMMLKHFNYDKGRGLPYKDLENEEYTVRYVMLTYKIMCFMCFHYWYNVSSVKSTECISHYRILFMN